jgi:hypothetical protein
VEAMELGIAVQTSCTDQNLAVHHFQRRANLLLIAVITRSQ